MADGINKGLNSLLKWGIENTVPGDQPAQNGTSTSTSTANGTSTTETGTTTTAADPMRGLDPELLAQLLGGPSDADRMKDAMAAIKDPQLDLENKLIAFDNLEQCVEGIDNANNLEPLGLWMPLVQELENEEAELRSMAAWCVGTAVQNNVKAQERLLVLGAIPTLANMATQDLKQVARKKAILALSSGVRNYQPSLDAALKALPAEYKTAELIDAEDMEAVDKLISHLREKSATKG